MRQVDITAATGVSKDKLQSMEESGNPRIDDLLAVVAYIGVPLGSVIRHPRRSGPWLPS